MRGDNRGVSDMIAFVIMFSLIITSVGLTYTFGYSALTDYQEGEQKRNAERAFVALSENLGDIEDSQVNGRSGELRLSGGSISVEEGTDITVTGNQTGADNWSRSFDDVGSLTYEFEGTRVEYESGAVFRQDDGNRRVMLSTPEIQCSDTHATVSVVKLRSDGSTFTSDGTVQVKGELQRSYLRYPMNRTGADDPSVSHVDVRIDSTKTEAWADYFEDTDWRQVSASGDSVTYRCGRDDGNEEMDLYVRQTLVRIEFIG